jgi:hypothetical protein
MDTWNPTQLARTPTLAKETGAAAHPPSRTVPVRTVPTSPPGPDRASRYDVPRTPGIQVDPLERP